MTPQPYAHAHDCGGALALRAHCTRTARYFLHQVAPEEFPSTPLPNALISPLPQEHVPL